MDGALMSGLHGAKLLVTGGSGFTGRQACAHFVSKGMKVLAMTRQPKDWEREGLPGTPIYGDLNDGVQIRKAIKEVQPDYVLHLAGQNAVQMSWKEPLQTVQVNMIGTLHVLDALRECPRSRCVVVTSKLKSSLFEMFSPAHPYAFSKGLQELAAVAWSEMFDLDVILAEPSNLIGPGPSTGICSLLAQHAVKEELGIAVSPFLLHVSQSTRDYVDVRDAVLAYEMLLQHGEIGNAYEIASGTRRTLQDVVHAFDSQLKSRLSVSWQLPLPMSGPIADTSKGIVRGSNPTQANSASRTTAGGRSPLSAADLGFQTSISFEQSIRDILNYYRKQMR